MEPTSGAIAGTFLEARGSRRTRLRDYLWQPVDIAPLVLFRIGFGALMVWEVARYFSKGWIERFFIEPRFLFPYVGFEWVRPWPGELMNLHFALLGLLAACILVGLFYRVATILFCLGFTYLFLLDQTQYLNHFYLIILISFLLIFLPVNRRFSLDVRWRGLRTAGQAPRWTLWILCFQIGMAYFFGGVAKLNSDWLQGEPMGLWLAEQTDFPVIGRWFGDHWMALLMSYAGLLFDLLIVPLLLWRRTRLPAFLVAVSFHLLNSQLFSIGIFPWFMLVATLLFFPAAHHRALLDRLIGNQASSLAPAAPVGPSRSRRLEVAVLWGLLAYVGVQLTVPLRHWLYPGNVSWTEEGHNFSWHMKLRSKSGDLAMVARRGEQTWPINLWVYLTKGQLDEVSTRPDMIVLLAHYVAEDFQRRGHGPVQVHAMAHASLNGRAPQSLIDPSVDLAAQKRSLAPAPYIVPVHQPLRPGASARR